MKWWQKLDAREVCDVATVITVGEKELIERLRIDYAVKHKQIVFKGEFYRELLLKGVEAMSREMI